MPTEMLTTDERQAGAPSEAERVHARRVHRLKLHAAAYGVGAVAVTALWAFLEWHWNGGFEQFAHEGNPGDWNPTVWALVIGLWGLAVGIMALQVRFERPGTGAGGRLRFHIAAWASGMLVLAPLNALIEWQDNGHFERLSANSQPGSWDPWALRVGAIWAIAIAIHALWTYRGQRKGRLHPSH